MAHIGAPMRGRETARRAQGAFDAVALDGDSPAGNVDSQSAYWIVCHWYVTR